MYIIFLLQTNVYSLYIHLDSPVLQNRVLPIFLKRTPPFRKQHPFEKSTPLWVLGNFHVVTGCYRFLMECFIFLDASNGSRLYGTELQNSKTQIYYDALPAQEKLIAFCLDVCFFSCHPHLSSECLSTFRSTAIPNGILPGLKKAPKHCRYPATKWDKPQSTLPETNSSPLKNGGWKTVLASC